MNYLTHQLLNSEELGILRKNLDKDGLFWEDGKKIFWQEGEPQVHYIMDHFHEGYNYSDDAMIFLMLDIKKSTEVKL